MSRHVLKPKLIRQIRIASDDDANRRSVISKRNTSTIFTQLYHALYGGKINHQRAEDTRLFLSGESRTFSPDVVTDGDQPEFTEVKAFSIRRNSPYCSVSQLENYAHAFLKMTESGKTPSVNYSLFRYGNSRKTNHLNILSNSGLVERLCTEDKSLTILPLNLVFFLLAFSNFRDMDQTTSQSSRDSQKYFHPYGKIFTEVRSGGNAISDLVIEYLENFTTKMHHVGDVEDLFLDGLVTERKYSKPLSLEYHGKTYHVKPFQITRYFHELGTYMKWVEHFSKDHKRILENLGLRDIYEEKRRISSYSVEEDDVPYQNET